MCALLDACLAARRCRLAFGQGLEAAGLVSSRRSSQHVDDALTQPFGFIRPDVSSCGDYSHVMGVFRENVQTLLVE